MQSLLEEKAAQLSALSSCVSAEGFVVRLRQRFTDDEFEQCMAKFVRKGHIQVLLELADQG
jgi:NADPH-dependent curcumin reductase CurA